MGHDQKESNNKRRYFRKDVLESVGIGGAAGLMMYGLIKIAEYISRQDLLTTPQTWIVFGLTVMAIGRAWYINPVSPISDRHSRKR